MAVAVRAHCFEVLALCLILDNRHLQIALRLLHSYQYTDQWGAILADSEHLPARKPWLHYPDLSATLGLAFSEGSVDFVRNNKF